MAKGPVFGNQINLSPMAIHPDATGYDTLIASNGVVMEHWRAVACPIGLTDRFDIRSHGDHADCQNGFIYVHAGDVTVQFNGNSGKTFLEEMGLIDGSSTTITLPRFYDSKPDEEICVQHRDRFFLKELATTTATTQLVEAHVTGRDRLVYQPLKIEYIRDANNVEYSKDDYRIEGGVLVWNSQKRPQFDPKTGKGTIYSVRYRFQSFWYVKQLLHEIRVAKAFDPATNQDRLVRLPYEVLLQREEVFENEERSEKTNQPAFRQVKAPRSGSYGPR